jgi:hypothetical protein
MSIKGHVAVALLSGAVGGLALASSPALADVCLTVEGVTQSLSTGTQGTCTTSGEQDVFLSKEKNVTSGTGGVGSPGGAPTVDFSSSTALDFADGFSTIDPHANGHDASFADLTVTVPGFTFSDLLFKLQMQNLDHTDLVVTAWDGSVVEGSWDLTGLPHDAAQQYAVVASAGQMFTAVVLSAGAASGIKETKEFQVSGVTAIPESSTWAMMLMGLAGLGFAGYRKTKSSPALVA